VRGFVPDAVISESDASLEDYISRWTAGVEEIIRKVRRA
jgi:hypothetical protein